MKEWTGVTSSEVSVTCLLEPRDCIKDQKIKWRFIITWCIVAIFVVLVLFACAYERMKDDAEEVYLDPSEGNLIVVMNNQLGYRVQMAVAQIVEKGGITLVVLAAGPDEQNKIEERYIDLRTYHDLQKEERAYMREKDTAMDKKPSLFTRIMDPSAEHFDEKGKAKHTLPTGFFFISASDANKGTIAEEAVAEAKKKKNKKDHVNVAALEHEERHKQQRIKEFAAKRKKLMQETFQGDVYVRPEDAEHNSKIAKARQDQTKVFGLISNFRKSQESRDEHEFAEGDLEDGSSELKESEPVIFSNKVRMQSALQRRQEKAAREKAAVEKKSSELKIAKMLNVPEKRKKKKQEPNVAENKFTSLVNKGPKPEPVKSAKASAPQKEGETKEKPQAEAEAKDGGGLFTDILATIF